MTTAFARRLALVCLLAAATIVAGSVPGSRGEPASLAFAPTPSGPIYGGVSGALPSTFSYVYSGSYVGWPIAPIHAQHPVRGPFLDPRGLDHTALSVYHF